MFNTLQKLLLHENIKQQIQINKIQVNVTGKKIKKVSYTFISGLKKC
jgi:hypothetical protein